MDIISLIASAITNRKKEVINFIISHGGSINKGDSDVKIGDELSSLLSASDSNRNDFAKLLSSSSSAEGDTTGDAFSKVFSSVAGGLTGIFGTVGGIAAGSSAATASDQLRMQLINANIEEDKRSSSTITIAIIALFVVMIAIGFLIYKKYQ